MTTTLLTFLAIWWISGNQWDWKKTKFSHLHIEGRIWIASYGERRIWVITVWLPFATWLGQKGCSWLNIIVTNSYYYTSHLPYAQLLLRRRKKHMALQENVRMVWGSDSWMETEQILAKQIATSRCIAEKKKCKEEDVEAYHHISYITIWGIGKIKNF